jgi:chemotaxis protein MotB
MASVQPIIVVKKKSVHGGHHGGAWKVAYADFVTAMMALFIVLWLMSCTSKQTQEQIAGYFNDPRGTATKKGSEGNATLKPQDRQKVDMSALKDQILRAIQDVTFLDKLKKQIEITVTDEGLRIDLVEDKKGTFFELGSAQPTPALQEILKVLSGELKQLPNRISIEGHTDAQPYANLAAYGNWELSSDRANEARREMQADGVRLNQVLQVRGFADQQLHIPDKPFDPANRRVSVVVLRPSQPGPAPTRKPEQGRVEAKYVETKPAETKDVVQAPSVVASAQIPEKPVAGVWQRTKKVFGK